MKWKIESRLRDILVCPECKGQLTDVDRGLLCPKHERVYLVVEGVPMMLPELSKPANPKELGGLVAKDT